MPLYIETVAKYKVSRQTYEILELQTAICPRFWHLGSQFGEILEESFTTVVFRNSFIPFTVEILIK